MNCRGSMRLALAAHARDGRPRAVVTTRPPILLELGPDSDVAVRESDDGALRCVGCSLRYGEGDFVASAGRWFATSCCIRRKASGFPPAPSKRSRRPIRRREEDVVDVNYRGALIAVAEDCPVEASVVPELRGGKKTLPLIQYELLRDSPYKYTSAEVLFESNMQHKGLAAGELKRRRRELWDAFFEKPQPCLRASGLPKKYGWGIHCDEEGKIALCPMESPEYRRLSGGSSGTKVLKAFRSSKAAT
jgi:hypothetical protein